MSYTYFFKIREFVVWTEDLLWEVFESLKEFWCVQLQREYVNRTRLRKEMIWDISNPFGRGNVSGTAGSEELPKIWSPVQSVCWYSLPEFFSIILNFSSISLMRADILWFSCFSDSFSDFNEVFSFDKIAFYKWTKTNIKNMILDTT